MKEELQPHPKAEILRAIADGSTEWKEVESYSGKYFVSTNGEVFSMPREGTVGGILTQKLTTQGYRSVCLTRSKTSKSHALVHRLVACAFIPNTSSKRTVNHKNGVKTDNIVSNLEWATHSENVKHAIDTGLAVPKKGQDWHCASITNEMAISCNKMLLDGLAPSIVSKELNISIGVVRAIKSAKGWSHLTGRTLAMKGTTKGRVPKSGHKNISITRKEKFQVVIPVPGKNIAKYIGRFGTLEQAILARDTATKEAAIAHAEALLSFTRSDK